MLFFFKEKVEAKENLSFFEKKTKIQGQHFYMSVPIIDTFSGLVMKRGRIIGSMNFEVHPPP